MTKDDDKKPKKRYICPVHGDVVAVLPMAEGLGGKILCGVCYVQNVLNVHCRECEVVEED